MKHLETRWLWLQGWDRAKEVVIGVIDTSLNTADLGTKHHPAKRQHELIAMLPVMVGLGLLVQGADAKEVPMHDKEDIDETSSGVLFVFILLLALAAGFFLGLRVTSHRARLLAVRLGEQHAEEQAQMEKKLEEANEEKRKRWNEVYQVAKWRLHCHTADELKRACGDMGFQCGHGATKEAMARGLLAEHGFDLQKLSREGGGLLGAMASGFEAGSHMQEHVMRSGTPAVGRARIAEEVGAYRPTESKKQG